jgi:hypothetical protein
MPRDAARREPGTEGRKSRFEQDRNELTAEIELAITFSGNCRSPSRRSRLLMSRDPLKDSKSAGSQVPGFHPRF